MNKALVIIGFIIFFYEAKSQDLPFIYIGIEIEDYNMLLKGCQHRTLVIDSAENIISVESYNCLNFDSITSVFKNDYLIQLKLFYTDSVIFNGIKIYADKNLRFLKKNEWVVNKIKIINLGYKRGHCHYDLISRINLVSNITSYEVAIYDKNSFIYKR